MVLQLTQRINHVTGHTTQLLQIETFAGFCENISDEKFEELFIAKQKNH